MVVTWCIVALLRSAKAKYSFLGGQGSCCIFGTHAINPSVMNNKICYIQNL